MKQSNQTNMWYSYETGIKTLSDRAKVVNSYPYNKYGQYAANHHAGTKRER
jgi:hypothetical protein